MVHRDIKPSNIRIGRHGNVKLLDFGIAKSGLVCRARTQADVVVGTMMYLAPERLDPSSKPQPASDIFALGCVLYEGLRGARLLPGSSPARLVSVLHEPSSLQRHVAQSIAPLGAMPVCALLVRMLAHDPQARPDADEVARCIVFLASEAASWVTGTNLIVDGGFTKRVQF